MQPRQKSGHERIGTPLRRYESSARIQGAPLGDWDPGQRGQGMPYARDRRFRSAPLGGGAPVQC